MDFGVFMLDRAFNLGFKLQASRQTSEVLKTSEVFFG
jgi:hypothetical protein